MLYGPTFSPSTGAGVSRTPVGAGVVGVGIVGAGVAGVGIVGAAVVGAGETGAGVGSPKGKGKGHHRRVVGRSLDKTSPDKQRAGQAHHVSQWRTSEYCACMVGVIWIYFVGH